VLLVSRLVTISIHAVILIPTQLASAHLPASSLLLDKAEVSLHQASVVVETLFMRIPEFST